MISPGWAISLSWTPYLVTAFVITSLGFLLAVCKKRVETDGETALAHGVDA